MIPIAWRIARLGRRRVAVYRLLNSTRGWSHERTPVDDVRWAVEEIRRDFGRALPIGLVGHSLGGRAALLAAGAPEVTTAVALNPYLYSQDGAADLTGTAVLIVHGTQDRVASPPMAEVVARGLRRRTAVTLVRVQGGKHAMLSRHRVFETAATDFVLSGVIDRAGHGPWAPAGASKSVDL